MIMLAIRLVILLSVPVVLYLFYDHIKQKRLEQAARRKKEAEDRAKAVKLEIEALAQESLANKAERELSEVEQRFIEGNGELPPLLEEKDEGSRPQKAWFSKIVGK